jgi:hypothetical protein
MQTKLGYLFFLRTFAASSGSHSEKKKGHRANGARNSGVSGQKKGLKPNGPRNSEVTVF